MRRTAITRDRLCRDDHTDKPEKERAFQYRLVSLGSVLEFNNVLVFQTFQTSTFQNLKMDKHLEVAVCPYPNFGKFGKLESLEDMLLLLQLLLVTVLSLMHAKESKDDRSAQAVQDRASLTPVATRAGFSMAPRP